MPARSVTTPPTEHDAAQAQIRFQAHLLAAVGQAVVATDAVGTITYWNDAAERMFGWFEAEVLGRSVGDVVVPDESALAFDEAMEQLVRGETWAGEFLVRHRDGTQFPILTTGAPVLDDAGVLIGIIGVSTDITAAKRAEAALQRSEERLRGVLAASPLAIIEFDAAAEVMFWNPAAERLYGWTTKDLEAGRLRFSHPDEETAFHALFQRALSGETLHNVEVVRRRSKGGLLHFALSMSPLRDDQDRVTGVTSAGIDITHERQLEAELRESHKMEGIGRLAAGIAHDFNNLLTIVLGHAGLLLEELPAGGPAAGRVNSMYRAAGRAADLTDQLLTFSQSHVVSGEPVDLNEVLVSMEPMLARLVGERIDFQVGLCKGPAVVAADWSQVQQVVLNLVENAREAMPDGGSLVVSTETACALVGPSTARLRVSDTGIGMDEPTRATIFEPFFTTKDEKKGTGLGLSTVYGVATQHGGNVDVSSTPGAGSVFTLSLPLCEAPRPPGRPEE